MNVGIVFQCPVDPGKQNVIVFLVSLLHYTKDKGC
jgi:hypothetical protein